MIRRSLTITILLCCFVLCILSQQPPSMTNGFPKILWSYWEEGFDNNPSIKVYHELHRAMASGWQVHMLNRTTVMPFLQRIPYYQDDIDKINFYLLQHKSDYIRYLLISYYGGVWMDISSFFVEELDWLDFDRLRQNEDVINKHGAEPDVLLFTNNVHGSHETYFDRSLKQSFEISPGYELWFIAAKPRSQFFKIFLSQYRKGLLNNMHFTVGSQNYISILNRQHNVTLGQLYKNYYLCSLQTIQLIIQSKQSQLDQRHSKKQRQLAVWYYKIWHIKSENGPFGVTSFIKFFQIDILVKFSRTVLQQFNMKIKYFIKLMGPDRRLFRKYYFKAQKAKNFDQKINSLKAIQDEVVQSYFCPQQFAVHEESVFYQYVLKPSPYHFDIRLSNSSYRPIFQCSELRNFVIEAKKQDFRLFYQELMRVLAVPALLLLIILTILYLVKLFYQKCKGMSTPKQVRTKEFIQISLQ